MIIRYHTSDNQSADVFANGKYVGGNNFLDIEDTCIRTQIHFQQGSSK